MPTSTSEEDTLTGPSGGDADDPDASDYVEDGAVKWGTFASLLVSSFIYAWFDGVISTLAASFAAVESLLGAGIGWFADTASLLFTEPTAALSDVWAAAAAQFPVAGPLDWTLGVALIIGTWVLVREIWDRALEVI